MNVTVTTDLPDMGFRLCDPKNLQTFVYWCTKRNQFSEAICEPAGEICPVCQEAKGKCRPIRQLVHPGMDFTPI